MTAIMAEGGDYPKPAFIQIQDLTEAIEKKINPDEAEVYIVREEQVLKLYLKRKETRDQLVRDGIQLLSVFDSEISTIQIHDALNPFCLVCNEPNHDPGSAQCRNKSVIITENHPLSNFYLADFIYKKLVFKSAEHAYECYKARKHNEKGETKDIYYSASPFTAKSIGDTIPESPKWRAVKERVMREILEAKTSQLPRVLEEFQRASSNTEFKVDPEQDFLGENLKLGQLLKKLVAENILTLVSLNVNGLQEKRDKLRKWITDGKFGIVFLQETHFVAGKNPENECMPDLFQNVHCFSNNSASRGVSILIKKSLCAEIPTKNLYKSEDGRTLKVNFMHRGKTNLTLICVYAPNIPKERTFYFLRLCDLITKEKKKCQSIIICGDFNCDLNYDSDQSAETLRHVIRQCSLIDAWRHLQGNNQGHTYVRGSSHRRIDYVFLTENLIFPSSNDMPNQGTKTVLFPLSDISLHDSEIGDHKEIHFELNTISEIQHPS